MLYSRYRSKFCTSIFFLLPFRNSNHAEKRLSIEIIFLKTPLWKRIILAPPPPSEIPLVQKLYNFYLLFHDYLKRFPKYERHTLGQTSQSTALNLLKTMISCGTLNPESRKQKLSSASNELDFLRLLIRLSFEVKAINQKGYIKLQECLDEIGRMIGGWLRSLK